MRRQPAVYIMANKRNGTLYTGVTSNLPKRVWEHKSGIFGGFSHQHGCNILVWFETQYTMEAAILYEKRLKRWRRAWKLELIEQANPHWRDLAVDIGGVL